MTKQKVSINSINWTTTAYSGRYKDYTIDAYKLMGDYEEPIFKWRVYNKTIAEDLFGGQEPTMRHALSRAIFCLNRFLADKNNRVERLRREE